MAQKGRMRTGQVVSVKMEKTIAVNVEQRVAHPLYRKIVRRHKKLYAHDEGSVAKPGDWVRIQESRPLSRLKCWRLVEIVRPARQEEAV
ncbi:MAG: 30S ribosomal protein S17 [Methylacidiphilaceae bacterium]|nr:30S ribosomal protein S17 [Candidatus Methylacidiphilaceae bacterium]